MNSEDAVSFKATIQFNINGYRSEISSEVQIITITEKNIDVVYIISPETKGNHLPDAYPSNSVAFSHVNNQCLIIKGRSALDEEYIVSIFPLNQNA